MNNVLSILFRSRTGTSLGLACAMVLSACSTTSTPESVQQSLEKTTPERQTIATVALAQVGDAYRANMAGPDQYDDSGLVYYAYRQNGRALPRGLQAQIEAGHPIPLAQAEPGDLVFFRMDSPNGQGRLTVGVLIDSQLAVLALPGTLDQGGGVRRVSLSGDYWQQRLVGVARLLPEATASR
ncbi:NlpC/P60 family protein [Salinisphaera sp. SPP-AMP-43]|uniref:C40 family peptidase n=1 Tax=Salinisphaera sp. SPP-AMP-43 TaxID=3121288 RepID=UPI003C6DFE41